tara:strand:- start:5210 stop:5401 length:192 start_codon:yes stop_codon:yes gene_type:complete
MIPITRLKNKVILEDEKGVPAQRKLHPWTIVPIVMFGLAIPTLGMALVVGFVIGIIALNKINK